MNDELLLRSFIAHTVGTLEGALSGLEITKSDLYEKLKVLFIPIIAKGHKVLATYPEEAQE